MNFIDSHTHLDFAEFDHDRNEVLNRAAKNHISDIIISATTAKRWPLISQLACENCAPKCHVAFGLHPMFMSEHKDEDIAALKKILSSQKAVAVAEIGLDFFISNPDRDAQIKLFVAQLDIAQQMNLPVIIHARKSQDIVLKYLRRFPDLRGSLHSFSGSEQQARQFIDLGFYLGFGGPITYTRATRLRKLVSSLPLDTMLIETDSPDQSDSKHQGKRNEPAYLPNVAVTIAHLRDISVEEVAQATSDNARILFKLKVN